MKASAFISRTGLTLFALLSSLCYVPGARADITVRLSVKFIRNWDGTRPFCNCDGVSNTNIGMSSGFAGEIIRGNQILAVTGRGYKLVVVEYRDIQPSAPAGQPADYWFTLSARTNRQIFENAALADPGTWQWNPNAVNFFVNNSGSGSCSFPGAGGSISLGANIVIGTVLHETGHAMGLLHTHAGDTDCTTTTPPYPLADGDGLAVTVPDHNCIKTRDALIAALSPADKPRVDTAWLNVMSYHQEDQLLDDQMDIWSQHGDGLRFYVCSGKTWFVVVGGNDARSGDSAGEAFGTVARGLSSAARADDVILLRSGTYTAPSDHTIGTPCTLRATRGSVSIRIP